MASFQIRFGLTLRAVKSSRARIFCLPLASGEHPICVGLMKSMIDGESVTMEFFELKSKRLR